MRHPGYQLLAALRAALLGFERGLELCGHEVDGVARGLELVVPSVGDGAVKVAALDALDPRDELIERHGDMMEERAREIYIREAYRQQQRRADRAEVYPDEGLEARERCLVLFERHVHLLKAQAEPGEICCLKYVERYPAAEQEQQRRNEQRDKKHTYIRPCKSLSDGHRRHLIERYLTIIYHKLTAEY